MVKRDGLRPRAEKTLGTSKPKEDEAVSTQEARHLIHELRVHQIELDMQNEELRRSQIELDAIRMRYFDLFELAPVGYITVSKKGVIVEANLTAAKLLGVARGALTKRPFSAFILPDDQHIHYLYCRQLLERGEPVSFELQMVRADGMPFWANLTISVVRGVDSQALSCIVISDISERKRMEETLRESRERYALTLAAVNDGIWEWHIPTGNCYLSAFYYEIIGYENGGFPPSYDAWRARVHPEDIDRVEHELQNKVQTGKGFSIDFRMRKKTGEWLWVSARGKATELDADGKALRMVGVLSDITGRKQTETYAEMGREILQILNEPGDMKYSVQRVLDTLQKRTGVDAVAIRLQDKDDVPYYAQKGFPVDFLRAENSLIAHSEDGRVCRDSDGAIQLECTCGLVLSGKPGTAGQNLTPGGSFWTNNSSLLLNLPPTEDPRLHPRNLCIHQGYASVALVPIRNAGTIVGLVQLNDRRTGCFTCDTIELLEGIASHIGAALLRKQIEAALRESEASLQLSQNELERRILERTAELEIALKALKADEERFRTVADFTYNWETWIGPDGCYRYVSPSCKRISGYFAEEFHEDPALMEKIIHPEDRPDFKKTLKNSLDRKGAATLEFRIITRHRKTRWITLTSQAVYNHNGEWLGRRDSYRDTTDHKLAEERLTESQARYQALVESTHDWVWETDRNGVYIYVSPRSMDLLGHAPEAMIGKPTFDFMLAEKSQTDLLRLKKAFESMEPFRGIEKICRHREGHAVIVETSGVPFFDSFGNSAGFRGIDRDISERKKMEAQTLRTRHLAAIGELAAGVAHEINNPINGIINYAQILADDAVTSGGNPEIPMRIIKEGDRVAEIVKNLLYFSRQGIGEKKPVSIRAVLDDSLALFSAQFKMEGIIVTVDIPDDIPPVIGNQQQLQQVFMNILGNSRHALLENRGALNGKVQKRIEITGQATTSKGVQMATISFSDNGSGIAPELLERVFDPFFTTKSVGEGTGLGLSISYGIVKDHGGNLLVESEPGNYTHVQVILPGYAAG